MSRVLIFGNSGSGKSWLASELSDVNTAHIALDDIFWMSGGYNRKRPKVEVLEKIQAIKSLPDWVVEGVYGKILLALIGKADSVIFLDFCWKDCEKALLSRVSESSQQINIKDAEKNFRDLIVWASDYYTRDSQNSYRFHQELYEQFDRGKYKLSSRDDVDKFLQQKKC
jgi:adenylate kinase family enzyme